MVNKDITSSLLDDEDDAPVCAMRPRGAKGTAIVPDRQSLAASIATLVLTLPALRKAAMLRMHASS